MNFWVYIIQSITQGSRYIGHTSDPDKRLTYHNKGANKSTKPNRPYKIVYLEKCKSKTEAIRRERKLKSYKGGDALINLIEKYKK